MASERKTGGAGSRLGSVLERAPRPEDSIDPDEDTAASAAPQEAKAASAASKKRKPRLEGKGRTVYIPDDLFERVLVQAHRKNKTISEYICALLERHVPDHRTVKAGRARPEPAEEQGGEAA